jgi:predicted MFS family arabinose efflux permease
MSTASSFGTRAADTSPPGLSLPLLALMTFASGTCIANLYYSQPLLEQMAQSMGVGEDVIGLVPTLTQVGYAVGMLLLVPLGDMLSRRRLAPLFTVLTAAMSLGVALSSSITLLLVFSFLLGLANLTAQLLIPLAASLAPAESRGRVVGTMLSGIFAGVLLSRTIAGFVGDAFGWRVMYWLATVLLGLLTAALVGMLPQTQPTFHGRYRDLLASIATLVREQPVLREACLIGFTLFASFMVFWSTLIHLMVAPPFNLGATSVGLYGILGVAATLVSPIVGKLADRGLARRVAGTMVVVTILSFGLFWFGRTSLLWIGVGVLVMDLGVQLAHVSNQSRILHLQHGAQSRIQTAYMTSYFAGGGLGAGLGSIAWAHWGWAGVCVSAIAVLLVPLVKCLKPVKQAAKCTVLTEG